MKRPSRRRGGASAPCPECGADSKVVLTRRVGARVVRQRRCAAGHRFKTREGSVKEKA